LRGIEKALNSLEGSGIRPVAISADTPEESRELCRKAGLTFPILSDRKAQAIRRYDLLVAAAGEDGRDIAGTAEFLLDSSGTVRWRKMYETKAEQFVDAAKTLAP
jgi:peroxiredoxin